jgi:hypothetical protein
MLPPVAHASKRRDQRTVLLIGAVVAGLPILPQVLMAGAMQIDPEAFRHRDRTSSDVRFWPNQIVLLCVAVAGNAAVDWIRIMRKSENLARPSLTSFLLLVVFFVFVSIMFSVSLLDDRIGWLWLAIMSVFGVTDLVWAYLWEMEIATLAN